MEFCQNVNGFSWTVVKLIFRFKDLRFTDLSYFPSPLGELEGATYQ